MIQLKLTSLSHGSPINSSDLYFVVLKAIDIIQGFSAICL